MNKILVPESNSSPKEDETIKDQKVHPNIYEGYYYGETSSIVTKDNESRPRLRRLAPPYCNPDDYYGSDLV